MDEELFEDLLESVREAGAVLRGEREAARRTRIAEAAHGAGAGDVLPGASGSDAADA